MMTNYQCRNCRHEERHPGWPEDISCPECSEKMDGETIKDEDFDDN